MVIRKASLRKGLLRMRPGEAAKEHSRQWEAWAKTWRRVKEAAQVGKGKLKEI